MSISPYYLIPPLPEGLEGLAEMGLDLRWSWSHATDALWERIDPEIWAATHNPWLILQTVAADKLEALAADPTFQKPVDEAMAAYQEAKTAPAWFQQAHPGSSLTAAYFSMEFGLSEALPIYSGGLGVLAGDYLKTASDLGVPLVGLGLLYQQGYFRQSLDASGAQMEFYPYNDPSQLPILPVRDRKGEWLQVEVALPGRRLLLRAWEAKVGRVTLYLLDSNSPLNSPADRGVTNELYGGGAELRLQQEMALGIGGWKLLRALGLEAEICHLNEGHAALAVLERTRTFMEDSGRPFQEALIATRAGNIFTTHTPVEAGFDRFSPALAGQYLGNYAEQLGIGLDDLLALGRQDPADAKEPFNMAYLAIRGAGAINGVSRLHGEVSRRIFQPLFPHWPNSQVPISHVTNGVHIPSWDSAAADELWTETCGKTRWLDTLDTVEDFLKQVTDEALWTFRTRGRQQVIQYAREHLALQLEARGASKTEVRQAEQVLDPNALTIGFARRFATYKRPNLLLQHRDRLIRLLSDPHRPVQIIIAGKAHPLDEAGKALVQAWTEFVRHPEVRSRAIFLMDYDMAMAEHIVQGVDLWINTPRRPWEACGTSGMKVLVNGGLNLSELDGWWAEAYCEEVGWALGDGQEHDSDLSWDGWEAEQLYRILEEQVLPCFYDRDADGIPRNWVARIRKSMSELTPRFSSNRMLREYVDQLYLPAAEAYRGRTADEALKAAQIHRWRESLETHWGRLYFGELEVQSENGQLTFRVPAFLDDLEPDAVHVQLYAEPRETTEPEIHPMTRGQLLPGVVNGYLYSVRIPALRPASDYTPRIVPAFDGVAVPLEARQILWYV